MEQYSRTNDFEIHGIPLKTNENILKLNKEVGKALDKSITVNIINICHRLEKKPNNSIS